MYLWNFRSYYHLYYIYYGIFAQSLPENWSIMDVYEEVDEIIDWFH